MRIDISQAAVLERPPWRSSSETEPSVLCSLGDDGLNPKVHVSTHTRGSSKQEGSWWLTEAAGRYCEAEEDVNRYRQTSRRRRWRRRGGNVESYLVLGIVSGPNVREEKELASSLDERLREETGAEPTSSHGRSRPFRTSSSGCPPTIQPCCSQGRFPCVSLRRLPNPRSRA
jgi:hypothetical protein